jgi:3-oxoacyl-[acyl-carrier-protein] synthase II
MTHEAAGVTDARHGRVVVTGVGAVSPLGIGRQETFGNLVAGASGIDRITRFDPTRHQVRIAGEVKDFDPLNYMDRKLARRLGRYAHFAIATAAEAAAHARLDLSAEDPARVATVVGCAAGDFPLLEEQMSQYMACGPGRVHPLTVPRVSSSMAAANIAMHYGLTGPSFGTASACATGAHAVACAWLLLRAGCADVAFAGGTEAPITPTFIEGYTSLGALSRRNSEPARASRPFDRDRDGFVIAEGSAVLVLETLEHARRRGAPILAELTGVGMACEAYHLTASEPSGRAAGRAIRAALDTAGLRVGDVDYVNAHGTGTAFNDAAETGAIKAALGDHAYRTPVSSIKSMVGHCIGAAGALEAFTCVMALTEGVIPPTINLDAPSPECDLDYVPHVARRCSPRVAVSNSFAFGGQICVLVFERANGLVSAGT